MFKGGCLCGALRYEATGPVSHQTICHCTMCRRAAGAPCVAWFSVARSALRFVRGTPAQFRSSAKAARGFCPRCGTQLTFTHDDAPDLVDVTTCSLDDPTRLPPRDHTYTCSRLPWVRLADGLPEFHEVRTAA